MRSQDQRAKKTHLLFSIEKPLITYDVGGSSWFPPPPNVMGGGTFFVPSYLGGRLYLLPVIGGTVHDGGRDCYDGGSFNI